MAAGLLPFVQTPRHTPPHRRPGLFQVSGASVMKLQHFFDRRIHAAEFRQHIEVCQLARFVEGGVNTRLCCVDVVRWWASADGLAVVRDVTLYVPEQRALLLATEK